MVAGGARGSGLPHLDLGGSALDLAQVVGGQLDGGCSEVLVQALHRVHAEPLERAVHGLADVLGAAGEAHLPTLGVESEPEFGGDDHLVAEGGEGLTHELLVHERAIYLGGVEET